MTAKGIWNVVVSSPKVISNSNAGGRGGRREGGSFGLWVGGGCMKEMCWWLGLGLRDKKYNGGIYYCQITANALIRILEAQNLGNSTLGRGWCQKGHFHLIASQMITSSKGSSQGDIRPSS